MIAAMFLYGTGHSSRTSTGTAAIILSLGEVALVATCTSAMCAYGLMESPVGLECGTLIVHIA
jgi:hypothetical protein